MSATVGSRPKLLYAYLEQRIRIHSVGQRRRGVDDNIHARQRFPELALRDVGDLDDLERGVCAVQRPKGVDLLCARGCADAMAVLQKLVDDVRREKARGACDLKLRWHSN